MLMLSISDVLTVRLATVPATSNPSFYAGYFDSSPADGVLKLGVSSGLTDGTTPVEVIPPPPKPLITRNLSCFVLSNTDTASIVVGLFVGTCLVFKAQMAVGDTAIYSRETGVFRVTDLNGAIKQTVVMPSISIVEGKFLTISNSLIFAGTDGTTMTFPPTSATLARVDAANSFGGPQTFRGLIIPAGVIGIKGTSAGDSAQAGSIGEVLTATVPVESSIDLTTVTSVNVASISLSAGDWDVTGSVCFTLAATTTMGYLSGGINTVSATLPSNNAGVATQVGAGTNATTDVTVDPTIALPRVRFNLTVPTTVYLVARAKFAISTCRAYGTIYARRAR